MCQRINHHALNYLDRRAENAWMDAMQDHMQNGGRGDVFVLAASSPQSVSSDHGSN